ncbi:MFS transporter [Brachybacterium fresconis]|uniref:EmrB/QacA subfamily drug resistance transporter n=1 Tax=Brachybacterium fresconis TaxID=173363 RepID=A0ABS4YQE2_9MICO|nr:MFS transporter [Brachybacterium fresconis]MBP2410158.1 EmrB/QacA subfamily drug resistance transporter [Brachybacterium fresconis]
MTDTPTSTETTTAPTTTPTASPRAAWLTLIVVLLADAMDLMDATITNVAAPSIVQDLGVGDDVIPWLGAAYALALGSLLVLGGRLGDRFGQRRTFLVGLIGFMAGSALAGLAPTAGALIAARVVQGTFGALLIPQGMAIMAATFSKPMLRTAFAVFAPMLGVFAVAGPIVGGLLIDADLFGLAWRPIFLMNVVLGGIALVLALRHLPAVPPHRSVRIDARGSALLGTALFGLLFGLLTGASQGWGPVTIASTLLGGALLAAFAIRQVRTPDPLLPRQLLANRGFTSGLVVGLCVFAGFSGLMYVISLFFQLGLGYTPTQASLNLIPLTIGIIAGSGIANALILSLGRRVVLLGMLTTLLGTGVLLLIVLTAGLEATWWQNLIATSIIGTAAGISFNSVFNTALGNVQPEEAGSASGSLSAIQQVANGIGSALVTTIFLGNLAAGTIPAMTITLVIILVMAATCLLALPLLPRTAVMLED